MAPLHGVTNRVFRNAFVRHFRGFDYAMAPFILSIPAPRSRNAHFKDLFPEYNTRLPLVPQILSNDAVAFAQTASALAELGYAEVNWNLGCPYPMVTGKRRGSGLLPYPESIERFLAEACALSPLPVSIKLRLGLVDAREIMAIMPVLEAFPLKRIIIHPRIASQLYDGSIDLDAFAGAASLSGREVGYNGDIRDVSTWRSLAARFPKVNEWMIGRGAISDPFLPGRIKGASLPDDPKVALEAFHEDLYFGYRETLAGQKHALDKMKEIWSYLGSSFSSDGYGQKEIRKAFSFEAYEKAVRAVFSEERWVAGTNVETTAG
jgi:tRNA-dihydrouridine synthase